MSKHRRQARRLARHEAARIKRTAPHKIHITPEQHVEGKVTLTHDQEREVAERFMERQIESTAHYETHVGYAPVVPQLTPPDPGKFIQIPGVGRVHVSGHRRQITEPTVIYDPKTGSTRPARGHWDGKEMAVTHRTATGYETTMVKMPENHHIHRTFKSMWGWDFGHNHAGSNYNMPNMFARGVNYRFSVDGHVLFDNFVSGMGGGFIVCKRKYMEDAYPQGSFVQDMLKDIDLDDDAFLCFPTSEGMGHISVVEFDIKEGMAGILSVSDDHGNSTDITFTIKLPKEAFSFRRADGGMTLITIYGFDR